MKSRFLRDVGGTRRIGNAGSNTEELLQRIDKVFDFFLNQ